MFAVVGTFDRQGGKPSGVGAMLLHYLNCDGFNGGHLDDLDLDFSKFDSLLWMPNIDNAEDKILPRIKAQNRKLLLISSKRCIDNDYRESDVVGRLLATRSNLGIMIGMDGERFRFKLLDPLGNMFCDSIEIKDLCQAVQERVEFLQKMTRVRSVSLGERRPFEIDSTFLEIVRDFGDRFAEYVNAINPNRFLGNAATRCSYGFPAQRDGERILVSRRNVDKQGISADDFVEIDFSKEHRDAIGYYGNQKPSVDAPAQLMLFKLCPNINYVIHGHVYVAGAPTTARKTPCGALEEIVEIWPYLRDLQLTKFVVNLRGHGCIIGADRPEQLRETVFVSRPFPEG